ncbi:hypothetical protein Scep_022071 [Stephania cephalantha]|uniref:Uncharacterized protein n=1 Tax=Stephania cephalantha TaxID=152367 RepID=A0AAP0FA70_9MAGN
MLDQRRFATKQNSVRGSGTGASPISVSGIAAAAGATAAAGIVTVARIRIDAFRLDRRLRDSDSGECGCSGSGQLWRRNITVARIRDWHVSDRRLRQRRRRNRREAMRSSDSNKGGEGRSSLQDGDAVAGDAGDQHRSRGSGRVRRRRRRRQEEEEDEWTDGAQPEKKMTRLVQSDRWRLRGSLSGA